MPVSFIGCMIAAAGFYHLPVKALPAIQAVEGGYIGSVHPNSDGTHDLGLMQVNTLWIKPLAKTTGLPEQTVAVRLILNPCFNIVAAATILRGYLNESHGNIWQAIGYYHSHTAGLSTVYRMKVLEQALAMPGARAVLKRKAKSR
jgi:Transglycosylase SLT domain